MTTIEEMEEAAERQEAAERRNPLLKLNLGELVREMQILVLQNPNVLKSKDQRGSIDQETLAEYKKYDAMVDDLARREKEYNSYKSEPRF